MEKKNAVNNSKTDETEFAIHSSNYKLLLIGLAIIVLGFILMAGGGSDDPNVFKTEEIFSFRRISLSTIVVLFGFGFEVYAILRRPNLKVKS